MIPYKGCGNTAAICRGVSPNRYNYVIMRAMASQITSLTIVYSTGNSGAHQRKHQSSASLAFVRGIHRGTVNSPHKGPVTRKMFLFDDVIMLQRTLGIDIESSIVQWSDIIVISMPLQITQLHRLRKSLSLRDEESIPKIDISLGLKHDDIIKWKHFPRYCPFVRGFAGHRWIPHTKASHAGLWCFLWSAPE